MAATFTVEDGTGLEAANSYLSVAGADQYHEDHTASTSWSGATQAQKEKALRLATQYLDARFDGRWAGYKYTAEQALAWPRIEAVDNDGWAIDSDSIPQRLADATAELSLRVVDGDTLFEDETKPGLIKSKSVTVGPISKSVEYVSGIGPAKKYPLIEALLRPLLGSGSGVVIERG